MDMIYHLPFRDWLELDKNPEQSIAAAPDEDTAADSSDGSH